MARGGFIVKSKCSAHLQYLSSPVLWGWGHDRWFLQTNHRKHGIWYIACISRQIMNNFYLISSLWKAGHLNEMCCALRKCILRVKVKMWLITELWNKWCTGTLPILSEFWWWCLLHVKLFGHKTKGIMGPNFAFFSLCKFIFDAGFCPPHCTCGPPSLKRPGLLQAGLFRGLCSLSDGTLNT